LILQNPRHEQFAQAIAKGVNQTTAAKLAGYSERTACEQGSRLVRNAQIAARIQELRERGTEQAINEVAVSKEWVIRKLVGIVEKTTGEAHYAPTAANKSLELLGKEIGMFKEDMIPRVAFDLLLYRMGESLVDLIQDPVLLDKIAARWEKIRVQHPIARLATSIDPTSNTNAIDPPLDAPESTGAA
jgi:phage terminase small subunit